MSLKRQFSEEELPFFDEMYQLPSQPRRHFAKVANADDEPQPSTSAKEFNTLNTWNITSELRVSIVSHKGDNLKIHIRRFDGNRATSQGVTMCRKTWAEFSRKLKCIDTNFIDSGFIANNEVLVCISGESQVVVQNMFSFRKGNFGLKNTFLVLNRFEIEKLFGELDDLDKELCIDKLKYYFCYKND